MASPPGSQNAAVPLDVPPLDHAMSVEIAPDEPLPLLMDASEESAGAIPAYDTTTPCDEEGESKKRQVCGLWLIFWREKTNTLAECRAHGGTQGTRGCLPPDSPLGPLQFPAHDTVWL